MPKSQKTKDPLKTELVFLPFSSSSMLKVPLQIRNLSKTNKNYSLEADGLQGFYCISNSSEAHRYWAGYIASRKTSASEHGLTPEIHKVHPQGVKTSNSLILNNKVSFYEWNQK